MLNKLKYHLLTLPRWFALPYFGACILLGVVLAGGSLGSLNAWLVFIAGAFVMAGGHSANSVLDYAWTGLDKGEEEDRSAEKAYTGGQNLLAKGLVSVREVVANALAWYAASGIVLIFIHGSPWIWLVWALGALDTCWYSWSKFNWTHELALGTSVGPLAILLGMFAVNHHPPVLTGLIVSVPVAIILSFLGLSLDEWPDAEANLKKGVKSVAFMVWKYSEGKIEGLWIYCSMWVSFLMAYHVFLISQGYLKPATAMAFIVIVAFIPALLFMKANFRKTMAVIIPISALYPILLLIGQVI
jgi:4-hydroxybenzoate polyprenyltransferase